MSEAMAIGGLTVYADPAAGEADWPRADLVLFTRRAPSAENLRAVSRLSTAQTIVVGLPSCVSRFRLNQLPVRPGETRRVLGVDLEVSGSEEALYFSLSSPEAKLLWPPQS